MDFVYKEWLFNTNPYSIEGRPPNGNENWITSDDYKLFKSNLRKYPESIHLEEYIRNPIRYEFNNHGFRTSDDFNLQDEGNIFLGCSHTFGIGHHLENTWGYKLSQKIGSKFYNISEPGSGIYTQYRYLMYLKDKLNFKNVFHFLPSECWNRYEFIGSDGKHHGLDYENLSKDMLDILFVDEQIHFFNYVFIDAIRFMLNEMGVNYYLVTKSWMKHEIDPYHTTLTPARDLIHYYVEEHTELANLFYYKYQNNLVDNKDNSFSLEERNKPNIS